ncbi:MAG: hypothetical protein AAF563_18505 [Pseudomonadota bacterium]
MAATSNAYVVGQEQGPRKELRQAFDEPGRCIGRQATSLRSLLSLRDDDPKPDVVLIDMTRWGPDAAEDLDQLRETFPDVELLITYPRDWYH